MKNLIIFVLALFLAGAIVAGFIFHGKYQNTGEELQASNEKLSSLNDKIDQLTAENSKLSDQINKNIELDKKIDQLNKELETAVGRNTQLEDKLRLEQEMGASLKKEALSLKDMISKLQGQLQGKISLKEKIRKLQEGLRLEKEKGATLQKETLSLKDMISKLQDQLHGELSLKEKIRKLQEGLRLEKEKGATLQKETLSLKDMISKLQDQLHGELSLTDSRIKELKSASSSLITELERQLKNKEMTINGFKKKLTITFVDRLLFDLGKASITNEGSSILGKVGNILKNVQGMQIWIVGHTDNVPIKKEYQYKFPSNWELSASRAGAVANYFQKNNGINPETLTVIGRSFYEPLDTNNTKEGRARNRRVEIIIAPKLEKK